MSVDLDIAECNGQCHCGAVQFRVRLSNGLHTARRCTCSYCSMRGAVAVSAEIDGISFISGEDRLTEYKFNTQTARHYFCSICGIYTHHQRRSNPRQYGVNIACLENLGPFDLPSVTVYDGQAHPADSGALRIAGILRFEPNQT